MEVKYLSYIYIILIPINNNYLIVGFKPHDGIPQLVESYMKKEIMVDEFITHTMKLDKINEGFQLMKDGKSIRSVVIF